MLHNLTYHKIKTMSIGQKTQTFQNSRGHTYMIWPFVFGFPIRCKKSSQVFYILALCYNNLIIKLKTIKRVD